MGVSSPLDLFNKECYSELEGGILEAFGKLFAKDLRIYVNPKRDGAGVIRTSDNVDVPGQIRSLYRHLVERGKINQLERFDEGVLHIFSREVLQGIKNGDGSWEEMVPLEIAEIIKRSRFFGCQGTVSLERLNQHF
jgi:hypothetical protein